MLYALTTLGFLLAMLGMALAVLLGRRGSLERGCGSDCACLRAAGPCPRTDRCRRRRHSQ